MKNKWLLIVLALLPLSFLMAQASDPFNSGMVSTSSSMMQTGSAYSSQISPVGATSPFETQYSPSNRRGAFEKPGEANQSNDSPIGEPYVMVAFAALAAAAIYMWRRKQAKA
jgi:hypothetical protein